MGNTIAGGAPLARNYANLNANATRGPVGGGAQPDAGGGAPLDSLHPDLVAAIDEANQPAPKSAVDTAQEHYETAKTDWVSHVKNGMKDPDQKRFIGQLAHDASVQTQAAPGYDQLSTVQKSDALGLRMAGNADKIGQTPAGQAASADPKTGSFLGSAHNLTQAVQEKYDAAKADWVKHVNDGLKDPDENRGVTFFAQQATRQAQGVPGFNDLTKDKQSEAIGLRMASNVDTVAQTDKGQAAAGDPKTASFFKSAHGLVEAYHQYSQTGLH